MIANTSMVVAKLDHTISRLDSPTITKISRLSESLNDHAVNQLDFACKEVEEVDVC